MAVNAIQLPVHFVMLYMPPNNVFLLQIQWGRELKSRMKMQFYPHDAFTPTDMVGVMKKWMESWVHVVNE